MMDESSLPAGFAPQQHNTLWVGDLDQWCDEAYLQQIFSNRAPYIKQIKVIRDKVSKLPSGYGFVEFTDQKTAQDTLDIMNGQPIPGYAHKKFRLNWAQFGINGVKGQTGQLFSVFVGDLAPEVTDAVLESAFRKRFESVVGARVVTDPNTGRSKGYGFVRFSEENDSKRAIEEMSGEYLLSRPMRISIATPKKSDHQQPQQSTSIPQTEDPTNTTLFIGNLYSGATQQELQRHFGPYGEIVTIKIPPGRGCGFVSFTSRQSAEAAIQNLQGISIGPNRIRLSWGKNPSSTFNAPQNYSATYNPYGYNYQNPYGYGGYGQQSSYYSYYPQAQAYGYPSTPYSASTPYPAPQAPYASQYPNVDASGATAAPPLEQAYGASAAATPDASSAMAEPVDTEPSKPLDTNAKNELYIKRHSAQFVTGFVGYRKPRAD